jgi:hypothetical protein
MINGGDGMSIYDKANEFVELSRKKKALQDELGGLENKLDSLGKDLYWSFAAEKLDELSAGGYVLRPVLKFTASAKGDKTIRVLRRRGFGDLVKPVIHPGTAHAFVRIQTELGGGETPKWITDNFNICSKETISMRKE